MNNVKITDLDISKVASGTYKVGYEGKYTTTHDSLLYDDLMTVKDAGGLKNLYASELSELYHEDPIQTVLDLL